MMGPASVFQSGYQQGYRDGFRSGFASESPRWRGDGNRGSRRLLSRRQLLCSGFLHPRPPTTPIQTASPWPARTSQDKPFNPNPVLVSTAAITNIAGEYGNKNAYKGEYTDGLSRGYGPRLSEDTKGSPWSMGLSFAKRPRVARGSGVLAPSLPRGECRLQGTFANASKRERRRSVPRPGFEALDFSLCPNRPSFQPAFKQRGVGFLQ